MHGLKKLVKLVFPRYVVRKISGLFYGWSGNYKTWAEAQSKCTGYDSPEILQKVVSSTLKVKNGEAIYERDSYIFDQIHYNYPLLACLMWIAAQNKGKLSVLDFGGSLGSTYFQNRRFLNQIEELNWSIVEQESFVKKGLELIADERLMFYNSVDECLNFGIENKNEIDVIILSSVLQYLEKPYQLLEIINSKPINYILIDRTQFIEGDDRITVQRVNPMIYKASYPCWFFNKQKLLDYLAGSYNLIIEFDSIDRTNIKSESKGFLFKRRE